MTEQQKYDADRKKLDEIYSRLREQVRDENQLYHQRIIWLITMQAFLFATVGLVLQAHVSEPPFQTDNSNNQIWLFLGIYALISITGIYVALVSNNTLGYARETLNELGGKWDTHIKDPQLSEGVEDLYPHVQGRNKKPKLGFFRSGNLPLAFVVVWVAFAAIVISNELETIEAWLRSWAIH